MERHDGAEHDTNDDQDSDQGSGSYDAEHDTNDDEDSDQGSDMMSQGQADRNTHGSSQRALNAG